MSVIRKNMLALLVAQTATWGATLIAVTVVPNYLGEYDFGVLSYATAFIGFFTIILGLGTSLLMTREVAHDHSLLGPYVYNTTILKVVLTIVLSAIALVTARILNNTGDTFVLIALGCVGMLFFALAEVFVSALAGLERMARPAFWMVVQVYVATGVSVAVLAAGGGVVAYGVVYLLAGAIPTIASAIMVWPLVRGHRRLDFGIWRWFIAAGVPLTFLAASNLVYGTIDIPILKGLTDNATVGIYTLAQKWVFIPAFVSTAVAAAYYPRFSALAKTDRHEFAVQVNKAVLLVLVASVPMAIGLGLVAEDLVALIYRGKFTNTVVVMQILVFQVPVAVTDTILASGLLAAGRQNRYVIVAGTAAVLNPIACFLVIPWADERYGNGAIGAALATVATEVFITAGALLLRSPGVLDRRTVGRIGRILAAGVVMGGAVWAAHDLSVFIQIATGVVVYAAVFLLFRPISIGELRALLPGGRSAEYAQAVVGDVESDAPSGDAR